jgi:hypothetical protein
VGRKQREEEEVVVAGPCGLGVGGLACDGLGWGHRCRVAGVGVGTGLDLLLVFQASA